MPEKAKRAKVRKRMRQLEKSKNQKKSEKPKSRKPARKVEKSKRRKANPKSRKVEKYMLESEKSFVLFDFFTFCFFHFNLIIFRSNMGVYFELFSTF